MTDLQLFTKNNHIGSLEESSMCDSSYYYTDHVKRTPEKLSFLFLMPKESIL